MSSPRRVCGFTLLEVLVAFAVTALLLGALLPATVSGVEQLQAAHRRASALLVARSALERYSAVARFEEGVFDGRQGELRWKATIEKVAPEAAAAEPLTLRRVRVEVFANASSPLVSLATYRIGAPR